MNEPTVNIRQAMEYAGVSRRTVHYWIAQGKVRVVELPSGRKRIILASLRRKPQDSAQELRTSARPDQIDSVESAACYGRRSAAKSAR